ncbi:hypothetical protein [Amycolatopsis sp. NPDC003676]
MADQPRRGVVRGDSGNRRGWASGDGMVTSREALTDAPDRLTAWRWR